MYTFAEQCEEIQGLPLGDGTKKIFLNMTSKNGRPELVSLLQYMKNTTLDNPEILIRDSRILSLNRIVDEVKQSEEWEAVKMDILEVGLSRGEEVGMEIGEKKGKARINHLNQLLAETGRTEDIVKAAFDEEYQKQLMEELGI